MSSKSTYKIQRRPPNSPSCTVRNQFISLTTNSLNSDPYPLGPNTLTRIEKIMPDLRVFHIGLIKLERKPTGIEHRSEREVELAITQTKKDQP